jgi:Tfp pilus assembly protein PilO
MNSKNKESEELKDKYKEAEAYKVKYESALKDVQESECKYDKLLKQYHDMLSEKNKLASSVDSLSELNAQLEQQLEDVNSR